jgi:Rod binding domain-containing protein
MNTSADIQSAMAIAKSSPINAPQKTNNPAAAQKAAKEFEGVFISQFLSSMFEGISTDGPFGGGEGEQMFRSLMIDQYGKQIEAQGGFGLAKSVQSELLRTQEVGSKQAAQPAPQP